MCTSVVQARDGMREVGGVEYPMLLSTDQARDILNLSERSITRMCADGRLKAVKVGGVWRINRDALLEFAGLC